MTTTTGTTTDTSPGQGPFAIGFDSSAALVVFVFSHPYIWVHYFAVEKPDMRFLYSRD